MTTPPRTSYDDVPYDSFPFPQTHPDRLATLGRLFGLQPADLGRCRVLELGCAAGGNLIPMALALPGSEFVGVDLSAVQVAQGQRVIDALGLRNVRLHAASITDVDAGFGRFDYIVTHGVYSWVPNAVQDKLVAICAEQLEAGGIAYVSYNTLPGWRMRGMIRDLMRYHALGFPDPTQRVAQARAMLDFLARTVPAEGNAYGMLLKTELDVLRGAPDYYILHEHLEDINEPLYFHEFVERAARHGLQYLAEAELSTMLASNFAPDVAATVLRIAPDVVRQEQLMDFLRNRTFRQTLLVHRDRAVNRELTPQRVRGLWIAAALAPADATADPQRAGEEVFRAPNGGALRTSTPVTKAAARVLEARWPQAVSYDELLREATQRLGAAAEAGGHADEALASDLLQCAAAGLVELRAMASPFVVQPGDRPTASALARWQAGQGLPQVTTLRHESVRIDANLGRLLQLLDGTLDRAALERAVLGWALAGGGAAGVARQALAAQVRQRVDQALQQLGRSALLVA